jgi:hypothetical protein
MLASVETTPMLPGFSPVAGKPVLSDLTAICSLLTAGYGPCVRPSNVSALLGDDFTHGGPDRRARAAANGIFDG